jgi:hypothetical protein
VIRAVRYDSNVFFFFFCFPPNPQSLLQNIHVIGSSRHRIGLGFGFGFGSEWVNFKILGSSTSSSSLVRAFRSFHLQLQPEMSDSATPVGLAVPTRKPAPAIPAEEPKDTTHTQSQRYLSTRGGSYGVRKPN